MLTSGIILVTLVVTIMIILMLADYTPEKYTGTKTLEEYLSEQKKEV